MLHLLLRFHRRERWFPALVLFLLVFLLLAVLQRAPVFADPDSFYHLGMAEQIRDQGLVVRGFPWLPFTVLAHDYADQHLLYHVLLIPFVTWLPAIAGMKLATAFFGALAAVAFHALLFRLRVPGAWWWTAALFLSNPFLFRMGLAKAPSVALALLFIGLLLLFERRAWALAAWSVLYVWTYGGFPVLVVATFVYAAAAYAVPRFWGRGWGFLQRMRGALERRMHGGRRFPNVRLILAVLLGVGIGILLHPYFPRILLFEQHQLFDIGAVNYRSLIGVGGEWYPYPFRDLLLSGVFVAVAAVASLVLFAANLKRMSAQAWTGFVLYALFLALTLKSKRYVEYYVPMGFLFSGLTVRDALSGIHAGARWRTFLRRIAERPWERFGVIALATYLTAAVGIVSVRDTLGVARDLGHGQPVTKFAEVGAYLAAHSTPGQVVFHDDWDVFPALFYRDRVNAYIAGLDATFLYLADPVKHRRWVDVTTGRFTGDPYAVVRGDFGSAWVVIGKDHREMYRLIDGKSGFTLVREDGESWLYRVEVR